MKTDPNRWNSLPGSFDALNARQILYSDNEWGIPLIRGAPLRATPEWLAPYRTRIRSQKTLKGAYHFFLDDFRFESVWNRPNAALRAIQKVPIVLSPDFSLYRDWPLMLQMWNTYRNRWCGAWWQSQGVTVIPTVSWSTPESYEFCFAGIEQNSLVAIGTVGTNNNSTEKHLFLLGLHEMISRLQPSRILCYGPVPSEIKQEVEFITYPTRWKGIRYAAQSKR